MAHIFPAPKPVLEKYNNLIWSFLWGSKIKPMSGKALHCSVKKGGLSLIDSEVKGEALRACLPGHTINDNVSLICDVIHFANEYTPLPLSSIDQLNACNIVSHSFLFQVLGKFSWVPYSFNRFNPFINQSQVQLKFMKQENKTSKDIFLFVTNKNLQCQRLHKF